MYRYDKLKGRMVEKRFTYEEFAKAIGISPFTFAKKIANQYDFKQGEIIKTCEVLDLRREEIPKYFFEEEKK